MGTNAALDFHFAFYNSKNTLPGLSINAKDFEHIDGNIGKIEATVNDGRKDTDVLFHVQQSMNGQMFMLASFKVQQSILSNESSSLSTSLMSQALKDYDMSAASLCHPLDDGKAIWIQYHRKENLPE